MRRSTPAVKTFTVLGICLLVVLAFALPELNAEDSENKSTAQAVTQVQPHYVCMITNKVYEKPQIPVVVGDKTYYGCCDMCEEKLKTDPGSRTAVDPVTGEEVDKSDAIIGAAPDGTIVYFASVENLTEYNAGTKSKGDK